MPGPSSGAGQRHLPPGLAPTMEWEGRPPAKRVRVNLQRGVDGSIDPASLCAVPFDKPDHNRHGEPQAPPWSIPLPSHGARLPGELPRTRFHRLPLLPSAQGAQADGRIYPPMPRASPLSSVNNLSRSYGSRLPAVATQSQATMRRVTSDGLLEPGVSALAGRDPLGNRVRAGLRSVPRSNKTTRLLTRPGETDKSYAKDSSPRMVKLQSVS